MTPQELDKMVSAMRDHKANIKTRFDLGNYPYYLMHGLKAIGKNELAGELEVFGDVTPGTFIFALF